MSDPSTSDQFFVVKDGERWAAYSCTTNLTPIEERDVSLGVFRPEVPVVFRIHRSARPRDFGWTGTIVIVSQKAKDTFEALGLTGWTTYEVDVRSKEDLEIPGYYGLSITGRCGPVQWRRSRIVPVKMPGGMIPHFEGSYFDLSTWDGSDLFVSSGRGWFVFATAKASQAIRRFRLSNIRLLPTTEYRIPLGMVPVDEATP